MDESASNGVHSDRPSDEEIQVPSGNGDGPAPEEAETEEPSAETDEPSADTAEPVEAAATTESEAPTTAEPEAPAAEVPVEPEAPAAEVPVEPEEPAAEGPVAPAPVAEEPAITEVPAIEIPAVAAEEPAVEEQPAEEPATEEPAAEAPAVEEPAPEAPAVEEPAPEAPAVEEPAAEEPPAEPVAVPADIPAAAAEPSAELTAAVEEALEGVAEEEEEIVLDWLPGEWFVVHTYAGYENKVKTNLETRVHSMNMEDKIYEVVIPMEDVMEIKSGKKQVVQRKVFPGYLLVRMDLDDDSWYVVRNTPGVTGFVGSGTKPIPLSEKEVDRILQRKGVEEKPKPKIEYTSGDGVRVVSGPFANFQGVISDIDMDRSKLKVLVNIFGRETPVELGFDQVAKL